MGLPPCCCYTGTRNILHAQMKMVREGVVVALAKLVGVENIKVHRLVSGCLANLTTTREVTWELMQAQGHQVRVLRERWLPTYSREYAPAEEGRLTHFLSSERVHHQRRRGALFLQKRSVQALSTRKRLPVIICQAKIAFVNTTYKEFYKAEKMPQTASQSQSTEKYIHMPRERVSRLKGLDRGCVAQFSTIRSITTNTVAGKEGTQYASRNEHRRCFSETWKCPDQQLMDARALFASRKFRSWRSVLCQKSGSEPCEVGSPDINI